MNKRITRVSVAREPEIREEGKGNQRLAALVLDIERVTLHNKLKKYGWKRQAASAL
jgi:DNA-binding NtrC family response regulator